MAVVMHGAASTKTLRQVSLDAFDKEQENHYGWRRGSKVMVGSR